MKSLTDVANWATIELPETTDPFSSGWIATNDISLPNTGNRTIDVATVASGNGKNLSIRAGNGNGGSGGHLVLAPAAGTSGDDDGELRLEDAQGNVAMSIGWQPYGATEVHLSFYGVSKVARQTVNWSPGTDSKLKELLAALVALGLIDGQEIAS